MDQAARSADGTEADRWLWTDDGPFEACQRQTASALLAIAEVVRREPVASCDRREFLNLLDKAAGADADAFTRVWISPGARSWVNRAVDLFEALGRARRSNEGVEAAVAALDGHLVHFKRFALAQHLLSGADLVFESPYPCRLPFLVPGTGWQIGGPAGIDVLGTDGSGIRVLADGKEHLLDPHAPDSSGFSRVGVTAAPSVGPADEAIYLTPAALQLPWLEFGHVSRAVAFGLDGHERSRALVERALGLIERHAPDTFDRLIRHLQVIALGDPQGGSAENATSNETPGAFFAVATANPYRLADVFIHEFHHLRLFSLEQLMPQVIAAGGSGREPSLHYSPWRTDHRPVRGLFHATYVFQPVCRYWLDVFRSPSIDEDVRGYAADQVVRILLRLDIGLHILRRSNELTTAGRATLDRLARGAEKLRREANGLGLDRNRPAYVCRQDGRVEPIVDRATGEPATAWNVINEHARRYDLAGEAASVLAAAGA